MPFYIKNALSVRCHMTKKYSVGEPHILSLSFTRLNIARCEQSSHTPGDSHRGCNTFREKTKLLEIS